MDQDVPENPAGSSHADIALFIRESGDRQPCEVFPDREAIRLFERIRALDPCLCLAMVAASPFQLYGGSRLPRRTAEYHRRPHASRDGKMPLEVYLSQMEQVRTVSDPAMLDPLFLRRAKRTVKHDATFSLENRLYELPAAFAGQKIKLRYDEQAVHVYVEGKAVTEAKAARFADNAHVKRERPALSFKAIQEWAGEADV